MAQGVLERILDAEEQADKIKIAAQKEAEALLAQARQEAARQIEQLKEKAHAEASALIAAEEQQAQQEAEQIFCQGEEHAERLQQDAAAKIAKSVDLVLEKVLRRA